MPIKDHIIYCSVAKPDVCDMFCLSAFKACVPGVAMLTAPVSATLPVMFALCAGSAVEGPRGGGEEAEGHPEAVQRLGCQVSI